MTERMVEISIPGYSKNRRRCLLEEANAAIGATSSTDLALWSGRSAKNVLGISRRRITNAGVALKSIGNAITEETSVAVIAAKNGKQSSYLISVGNRPRDATASASNKTRNLVSYLGENPKQAALDCVTLAIGFYCGSGGLDGDGGIPDLDLELGIGAHRSIFTHSILSGIAIEAIAFFRSRSRGCHL